MSRSARQRGFTLIEVMIVVALMAILAAVLVPYLTDPADDARSAAAGFNQGALRGQIQLYRTEHHGRSPSESLGELLLATNAEGKPGSGPGFTLGPYLHQIPLNPFTRSNRVRVTSTNPPAAASGADDAGWLYHPPSGLVWLDHPDFVDGKTVAGSAMPAPFSAD